MPSYCIYIVPVQADTTGQNLVTREQAIVSILNTVGYGTLDETQNDLSAFSDADSITEEYIDEMAIAVTNGIILARYDIRSKRNGPAEFACSQSFNKSFPL